MHEVFMNTVRRFFTPEGFFGLAGGVLSPAKMKLLLILAFAVAVAGLVLWSSRAFRQWYRGLAARGGWCGILLAIPACLYKLLLVFMIARFLMVAMGYQARVFEHEHGRVTDKNRSAVLMKWGSPHEQRELGVTFTRKRTWVTRQLKLPDEIDHEERVIEGRIFSESYWKDEEQPVQAVEGKMPKVVSTREDERDVAVEQKAIQSADVDITVINNPRKLGGANYAGYEDEWAMKYTVANKALVDKQPVPVTAHMRFRLPSERDGYNEFRLTVDGKNVLDRAKVEGGALTWDAEFEPEQEAVVEVSYKSRGLEHLRYIPKRMTPTARYRVAMTLKGFQDAKMDYPMGSRPADETLQDMKGASYTLHWALDGAITNRDIGIKLPQARQPNYHIAHLLDEAPLGLLMLLVLMILPRLIGGRPVTVPVVLMVAVAYYLFYTFMGRLADLDMGFALAFLISAVALLAVVAFFRGQDKGEIFMLRQDIVAFAVLVVLYPLAVISEHTTFWMQLFYIALLLYVCALTVKCCVGAISSRAAAAGQAAPPDQPAA